MAPRSHRQNAFEAGLLNLTDEKAVEQESGSLPVRNTSFEEESHKERMSSPRRLALTVLVCFLATLGLASVLHHSKGTCLEGDNLPGKSGVKGTLQVQKNEPGPSFVELLRTASPEILHKLLHAYFPDRYQDGVFPSDHDALAAVHRDNAPLATTLARLARRQDGGTNSTGTPSETDTDPPASDPPGQTQDPPASDTDTNTDTDPPQTNDGGDGPTANTDSTPTPEPTPDPTPTEEPDNPATPKQTTPPKTTRSPSKSASAFTTTSTRPDGQLVTITSTSYYDVYPAEETDASETASLQNSGSRLPPALLLSVVLGMAAGAFLAV